MCGSIAAGVAMISLNGLTAVGIAGESVRENVRTNSGTARSANGTMLRKRGAVDCCSMACTTDADPDPINAGSTNPHIHSPAVVTISKSRVGCPYQGRDAAPSTSNVVRLM